MGERGERWGGREGSEWVVSEEARRGGGEKEGEGEREEGGAEGGWEGGGIHHEATDLLLLIRDAASVKDCRRQKVRHEF